MPKKKEIERTLHCDTTEQRVEAYLLASRLLVVLVGDDVPLSVAVVVAHQSEVERDGGLNISAEAVRRSGLWGVMHTEQPA